MNIIPYEQFIDTTYLSFDATVELVNSLAPHTIAIYDKQYSMCIDREKKRGYFMSACDVYHLHVKKDGKEVLYLCRPKRVGAC